MVKPLNIARAHTHARSTGRSVLRFTTAALLVVVVACAAVAAQEQASVADRLSEALRLRGEGRFDEGLAIAEAQLDRNDLTDQDKVAVYETLSIIYYNKGEDFYGKSKEYLDRICTVGPCVMALPRQFWPMGLKKNWYHVSEEHDALVCHQQQNDTMPLEIKTIAVIDFENTSVAEYQDKLGPIGRGLAEAMVREMSKVSALSVVERDKLDYILEEHLKVKKGLIDKKTAVRAGKILGCHVMVFGSFTQLDRDQTVVSLRAVNVETSEIIASVSLEGKPKYFSLVKELVKDLCDEIDVAVSKKEEKAIEQGGTESLDATTHYARGLEFEDKYDYRSAYQEFSKAYELDQDFEEARRKMDIYRPLAG